MVEDRKLIKIIVILSVVLVPQVNSFAYFRDRLPNGHRVPHPCKANYMWYGVGHENEQGGGTRNQFGKDFAKNGFTWNECLCHADSDRDGRTNGEELGDPDCQWTPGALPNRTNSITHPGVCEPYDSEICKAVDTFLNCEIKDDFVCDAINKPEVKNITLSILETAVPSDETTYMCQAFKLPQDADYHMIATTPYLVNRNVMHHIIVYGCSQQEAASFASFSEPYKCAMQACSTFIGFWSLGSGGLCLDDAMGFKVGKNGIQTVVVQLHWNNPELKSDYKDSSGMTLYLTPKTRPNDAGVLMAAPAMVQIPPGYLSYDNYGGCSGVCTQQMIGSNDTLKLTYFLPHMHYLGNSFLVQQKRDGKVIRSISLPQYFYDSPEVIYFDDPIELKGGDELNVNCTFQSKSAKQFTYFGEATSDEMCLAIFMYYPYKPSIGLCFTTDGYGTCADKTSGDFGAHGCDKSEFNKFVSNHHDVLCANCDDTGIVCRPGCEHVLEPIKQHKCMQHPVATAVKADFHSRQDSQKFLNMLSSCDPKPVYDIGDSNNNNNDVINIGPRDFMSGAIRTDALLMPIGLILVFIKEFI